MFKANINKKIVITIINCRFRCSWKAKTIKKAH